MNSRVAFLFLTYDKLVQPEVWKAFFDGSEDRRSIYCHPKHVMLTPFLQPYMISRHCQTRYARASLVQAMLYLLDDALRNKENQYFVFCSGACIPTCSFDTFYRVLHERGRSRLVHMRENLERYTKVDQSVVPYDCFYKSSQWIALTRPHAEICLNGPFAAYERSNVPDEMYFATTLAMAGINWAAEVDGTYMCYVMWAKSNGRTRPRSYVDISRELALSIRTAKALTARKFVESRRVLRDWYRLRDMMTPEVFGV